jgi:signal transduction histidine kinase
MTTALPTPIGAPQPARSSWRATRSTPDFASRPLAPLARWIEERHGAEVLERVATTAGTSAATMRAGNEWISLEVFEAIYEQARALCASDEEFAEACTYKIVEAYGALTYVLRAASILTAFETMARTSGVAFRSSTLAVEAGKRTSCRLVYRSKLEESPLHCLARRAQLTAVPLIWGLPRARCEHTRCVARGDDACVYELSWLEVAGLIRPLLGALCGLVLALGLWQLGVLAYFSAPALGGVGFLIGLVVELRRASSANSRHAEDARTALESLAGENAQATRDMQELLARQSAWTGVLEQRLEDRRRAVDAMRAEMDSVGQRRRRALRSLSHDLRNPLTVARLNAGVLRSALPDDPDALGAAEDLEESLSRLDGILTGLVELADGDGGLVPVRAQAMAVAPIGDRIRGVLNALTLRRDIRVSVFSTREKPPSISTDVVMFDRVLDNILTNSAKYTERGSIVVEVGGKPGFLCIKVSDTGRGMDQETIASRFRVAKADARPMVGDSHGHGLSIAVRLLDALGGRMEIMSEENVGTTFWLYFPAEIPSDRSSSSGELLIDDVLERTLRIRRVANDR